MHISQSLFNLLNTELNPICHLLVLVGAHPVFHISRIRVNLTAALHISGVTITHLQEHKTTVTTASGNRYTILLSAAIMEELELN
jgi:hypothetical protein